MTVETVTYISDLNNTLPAATDNQSEGDDHIRNLKTGLLGSFPNFAGAAMTATEVDLNRCDITTEGTSEASKVVTADASHVVNVTGTLQQGGNQVVDVASIKTIIKGSDETISNTTTYQVDNELLSGLLVEANTNYGIELFLRIESPAAADFKFYLGIGTSTSIAFSTDESTADTTYAAGAELDTVVNTTGTGTVDSIRVYGTVFVGVTGGSGLATLYWAQNTADAGNTTVLKGSWMRMWKET